MSSTNSNHADDEKEIHFVLHIVYNRENTDIKLPGYSHCVTLYAGKGEIKKLTPVKLLPLNQKFLTLKMLLANLVYHGLVALITIIGC